MDNNSNLWQSVLGELELNLSKASYKTWIETTNFLGVENGVAKLGVKNSWSRGRLQSEFNEIILLTLQKHNSKVKTVDYIISKASPEDSIEGLFSSVKETKTDKEIILDSNIQHKSKLSPTLVQSSYTFENFMVGSSNRLAFSAAQRVVEKPGLAYNPLFLYGPAGVGKTHLMWAISNEISKLQPGFNILYITSEEFTNEYVNAIRKGQKFTNKYREVDVLLVDDMQFIAGKEKTQEEFFHTFNSLHQNSRQIILCSDRPPKEIPTLEERLRSRFEWGMVADIATPDLETRIAIVLHKASLQNLELNKEVAEYIAKSSNENIRELEGRLTKLIGYCSAHNTDLTIEICEKVLGGVSNSSLITPKKVLEVTCTQYGINYSEIIGNKRDREIVLPRQVAMYIMREDMKLSFPKIALSLNGRDHTTIMHGVKKIKTVIDNDSNLAGEVKQLRKELFM